MAKKTRGKQGQLKRSFWEGVRRKPNYSKLVQV
jgi:hypothetical protein